MPAVPNQYVQCRSVKKWYRRNEMGQSSVNGPAEQPSNNIRAIASRNVAGPCQIAVVTDVASSTSTPMVASKK